MTPLCNLFNQWTSSERKWNHSLYMHLCFLSTYPEKNSSDFPRFHQQATPSPFTRHGGLYWRKQISWSLVKPSEPESLSIRSVRLHFSKLPQVILTCCQVRAPWKACTGFLLPNFSTSSTIVAFAVAPLLTGKEKRGVKDIITHNMRGPMRHWSWGIIPHPYSSQSRERVLSFFLDRSDRAAHRGWICTSETEKYLSSPKLMNGGMWSVIGKMHQVLTYLVKWSCGKIMYRKKPLCSWVLSSEIYFVLSVGEGGENPSAINAFINLYRAVRRLLKRAIFSFYLFSVCFYFLILNNGRVACPIASADRSLRRESQ